MQGKKCLNPGCFYLLLVFCLLKSRKKVEIENYIFYWLFMGDEIESLSEIASKFLFTSLRRKLSYHLLFLISLRNNLKSQF